MTPLISRRALLGAGATLVGSQVALGLFKTLEPLVGNGIQLDILRKALLDADLAGTAYAATAATDATLVHFVLIDKVQAALFQTVPGTPPAGLDSMDGIALQSVDFRGMPLTKLFADPLMKLPDDVGFCLNNAWESGTGGHSLQNSNLGDKGGVNHVFEQLTGGSGLLGAVGFSLRSDANDSADAFVAGSGRRMQAFPSVAQLSSTLANSLAPLSGSSADFALLQKFDALATKDMAFRTVLAELAEKVRGAVPDLTRAQGVEDPVMQQVQAVIALRNAGVCRNFMIAVPWDDTNGGGNLTTPGGSRNLSPFAATPKIAEALVALHAAIPGLVCVATSDGGRSVNNGDQSAGFAFLTGPATAVRSGIVGGHLTDTAQLGTTFTEVAHSNGEKKNSRPANWYATALKAMGLESGIEHVPEALV